MDFSKTLRINSNHYQMDIRLKKDILLTFAFVFMRVFQYIGIGALGLLLMACAQIGTLSGGEKDKTPPKLLQSLPKDSSLNVATQNTKIVFYFDEMVDVKNLSQNLLINPFLTEAPDVMALGKKVTLRFNQKLQDSTTYQINFGNSVVDIHEGNQHKNLSYLFSTGAVIDTNSWGGMVLWAQTQKPASNVWVALFTSLSDTAVTRTHPEYLIKTDSLGSFYFSNLKAGTYQAFALTDKNNNHNYDPGEGYAFLNHKITVPAYVKDTFLLSIPKTEKVFVKRKTPMFPGFIKYKLNDTLPNIYIIPLEKNYGTDTLTYETNDDELNVYYNHIYDRSIKFELKKDTLSFDTISIQTPKKNVMDSLVKKYSRRMNINTNKPSYGVTHDDVYLIFNVPIVSIDTSKCSLWHDSIPEKVQYSTENVNTEGRLVTTYLPLYKKRICNPLQAAKEYKLIFLPGGFTNYWGVSNTDTFNILFKTYPEKSISTIKVKLRVPPTIKNYILQLTTPTGKVITDQALEVKKENEVAFYNIQAGNYSLQLIDDKDGNQKFSPANLRLRTQPEPIYFYKESFKVPAGWDIEQEWDINKK
ncbi:MAG: Ig-like domain-containing protein [Bacteroidetes bacterium]|nr:Ig-like domain-containing protein [Bacteroidota bacterium]